MLADTQLNAVVFYLSSLSQLCRANLPVLMPVRIVTTNGEVPLRTRPGGH